MCGVGRGHHRPCGGRGPNRIAGDILELHHGEHSRGDIEPAE